jgi:hypothetical protein
VPEPLSCFVRYASGILSSLREGVSLGFKQPRSAGTAIIRSGGSTETFRKERLLLRDDV